MMFNYLPKWLKARIQARLWAAAPAWMERRLSRRMCPPWMMRLIDQTEIIFIHVPKTGGLSATTALYGRRWGHPCWQDWHRRDPIRFESYLKIAVVRDPVDRALSAYNYFYDLAVTWNRPFPVEIRHAVPGRERLPCDADRS